MNSLRTRLKRARKGRQKKVDSAPKGGLPDQNTELLLRQSQSPGDMLMLTAAVRDLHKAHPGKYKTTVESPCPALWENNPYVSEVGSDARVIDCKYDLVHRSNQCTRHFVTAFHDTLEQELGVEIPVTEPRGDIHLSDDERSWTPQIKPPFWIVCDGGKHDFTAKWWPHSYYQQVVDAFRGDIQFVQVGQSEHHHEPLDGAINLIDQTDLRQLVRLVYHSQGVLCGVTLLMHLAAAVPWESDLPRAAVVLAGGREPRSWEAYNWHEYLSIVGQLPCCKTAGCWRSRCQKIGDGDSKDEKDLCERPVHIDGVDYPECLTMITPDQTIAAIERCMDAGRLWLMPSHQIKQRPGTWDDAVVDEIWGRDHYRLRSLARHVNGQIKRIVDVGAHIGAWAALAHELWLDARIDCYEPYAPNAELLRQNLNGAVTVHEEAVTNLGGTVPFVPGELHGDTINTGAGRVDSEGPFTVPSVGANEIIGDGIDLLKLDCEGSEAEILEGMRDHLQDVKLIVAETHTPELAERCKDALAATHIIEYTRNAGLGRLRAWLKS